MVFEDLWSFRACRAAVVGTYIRETRHKVIIRTSNKGAFALAVRRIREQNSRRAYKNAPRAFDQKADLLALRGVRYETDHRKQDRPHWRR